MLSWGCDMWEIPATPWVSLGRNKWDLFQIRAQGGSRTRLWGLQIKQGQTSLSPHQGFGASSAPSRRENEGVQSPKNGLAPKEWELRV